MVRHQAAYPYPKCQPSFYFSSFYSVSGSRATATDKVLFTSEAHRGLTLTRMNYAWISARYADFGSFFSLAIRCTQLHTNSEK